VLANFFFHFSFEEYLKLNPSILISKGYLWQIFSYPLAENSIWQILILGLVLLIFFPILRSMYNRWFFLAFFSLLIAMQGAIATVLFWGQNVDFRGISAITSFILTLSLILFPKERFMLGRLPIIKNVHIVLIFFLMIFTLGIPSYEKANFASIAAFTFPIMFGSAIAGLFFLQVWFIKKIYLPKKHTESINEIKQILTQARESVKKMESSLVDEAVYAGPQVARIRPQDLRNKKLLEFTDDPEENEEKLNIILDKIHNKGIGALSINEMEFLNLYSDNLKI